MGDTLSQDEIEALLGNSNIINDDNSDSTLDKQLISLMEDVGKDTMKMAASTLESVLRQPVTLGDPVLRYIKVSELKNFYTMPSVGVRIDFKVGLLGSNILIIEDKDAKIISNLMMGGDGTNIAEGEITELDFSAIGEAMNQSIGSASTVYANMLGEKVDINTPNVFNIDFDKPDFFNDFGFDDNLNIIFTEFPLKIGNLIDRNLISLFPLEFVEILSDKINENGYTFQSGRVIAGAKMMEEIKPPTENINTAPVNNQPIASSMQNTSSNIGQNVNAQPIQFQEFDHAELIQQKENIDIIMDVPLEVTVEMGRTNKKVQEILEFTPGTVIELDKLAGDPIDVLVNGKFVAKGEVVVVDENYGIRITDIISEKNRI